MQANCSILPDGLCTHSHIPTLHTVYSHGHPELPKRVSAQMVGLWKVPGRKSEAESQDFPTPHSAAQLMSPSRFHQHHSRIPVPCLAPTKFLGIKWEDSPAGFGVVWPRLSPQMKDLPPKAWANCLPSGSLAPHAVWTLRFPWTGGRVGVPCPPVVPSLLCTTGRGGKAQRRWKTCLQLWVPSCPPPCSVQMRRPRGPRGQTGCGPWGAAAAPQDSHSHRLTTGCGPSLDPVPMSPDRAQEASHPDMRSQLFVFLPGLIPCSRGWDPVSHSESALDSLAPNRTQNFIFPVPSRNGIYLSSWVVS